MINGEKREIDAEDNMPLLWAIHDIASLTGTKFGRDKSLHQLSIVSALNKVA